MGVAYNSSIVTSGLVLALDAANTKNYNLTAVEVLVVAGGGGGGRYGGGGGAGGLIYSSIHSITPGSALTVTIGDGGAGHQGDAQSGGTAANGTNSVFGSLIAIGGGGGGNYNNSGTANLSSGASGGSSGGNGSNGPGRQSEQSIKNAPTSGQGNYGGFQSTGYATGGGGGGGAGAGGADGIAGGPGGVGGIGYLSSISGTPTYYSGGGSGTGGQVAVTVASSLGGGGVGLGAGLSSSLIDATPNTGGGGGGGADNIISGTYRAGNGGSGIIIVRYQGPQKAIGGTITSNNGYTIHTFITSGNFTPLVATNNSAVLGLSDFSGRNNFATAVSGPTYSSANGGSIAFNGSSQYSTITSGGIITNDISVDIWFIVNSAKAYTALLGSNATEKYEMLIKSASNLEISLAPGNYIQHNNILSINTWTNIVVSASNGVAWKVYKNGVDLGNPPTIAGTYQISGTGVSTIDQGRIRNDVGSFGFSGNISSTKIYNRALSAAEITQNYNALKSRYI
jgi:hypothetical protein